MEKRNNPSINVDEPVAITLLAKAQRECSGRFVSWAHDGIVIKLGTPLNAGSVLKLEIGDNVVVAEVRECEADGAEYRAGLALMEWIAKSELQKLMQAIATAKLIPERAAA